MTVENEQDLLGLKAIGRIVGLTIQHMAQHLQPGMTTAELDAIGAEFLAQQGARSAPILAYNFPGHTCISINSEAAHGAPRSDRVIQPGDLVNIDVSAEKDGYWADSGMSFHVPPYDPAKQKLLRVARRALDVAIQQARAGRLINQVGKAVETYAKKQGFFVIRELNGHGIGRFIHEAPSVPHFYNPSFKERFEVGMVLTLEPFIAMQPTRIFEGEDGWLLKTNGTLVAQYEHTIVITENEPILLTAV
ncbi:MAG: methionine aminopeptidase [Patescibacteria group bacterium]|nr:MAG: type I methionyl aminopeptidase [Phototrophicales bacterium]GIW60624.1 MAG: methionine aminopeptidase [Patescibacteria group bacterium]